MKFDIKKMYCPLMCAIAGLLGLFLLTFNYGSVYYDFGRQSKSVSYDGYELIENSLPEVLTGIYESFGMDKDAPSITKILPPMQILILVMAVLLIALAAIGFVKEYANIEFLDKLETQKLNGYSKKLFNFFCKFTIISVIVFLGVCLLSTYQGSVMGSSIQLGVKPDMELFFIAIIAFIELRVFKKFDKTKKKKKKNKADEEESQEIAPEAPVEETQNETV